MIVARTNFAFQAWAISFIIHIFALLVSSFTFTSQRRSPADNSINPVQIAQQVYLANRPAAAAKPKVKAPDTERISITNLSSEYRSAFASPKNAAYSFSEGLIEPLDSQTKGHGDQAASISDMFSPQIDLPQSRPLQTEFFTANTDKRKICYVVDCTGSMQGLFPRVRKELRKSIAGLEQDQFFALLFFGSSRLIEFEGGCLVRASAKNKEKAFDFIEAIEPGGSADGLAALTKSLSIKDSFGGFSEVIYFLTDGFELTAGMLPSEQYISQLSVREGTEINSIAFWPLDEDKKILQLISQKFSGQLLIIEDEKQIRK